MKTMDSTVSKSMGAMKAVKATFKGLHGVFKTLSKQHGEAAGLLQRAKASDDKFTELWATIRTELLSHERAEMREVYSVLRTKAELREMCDRHDAEASELEAMIDRIQDLPIASDERRRIFERLADTVVQHAKEEEDEIFPAAQQAIGKERAEQLDRVFLDAKRLAADAA